MPTETLLAIVRSAVHRERGRAWLAGEAIHAAALGTLLARLSGSVSPPPSGEERPALTREETDATMLLVDAAAVEASAAQWRQGSEAYRAAMAKAARIRRAADLASSSSSVPSETEETARLRAAMEKIMEALTTSPIHDRTLRAWKIARAALSRRSA